MELAESSVETASPRVIGRPFVPGMSGNPGGRPKGLAGYVRKLVGEDGRRVADFMLSVLEDERERTEVRMEAARWLADRGFGRAHVPVEAKQPEEPETIIIVSPIMSALKEGLEAQERELDAARPALPPGAE
jgi:hypothetical protein